MMSVAAPSWKRQLGHRPGCKPLCSDVPRPACKPSKMQRQLFAFHSSLQFCTPTEANFWRWWHKNAGFWKQIFKDFPGWHPWPSLREGLPHPAPIPSAVRGAQASQCWDPDHSAPLEVMVPHVGSNRTKLLAPPLNGVFIRCRFANYSTP